MSAFNVKGYGPASPVSDPVVPDTGPDAPGTPGVSAGNAQITVSFHALGNGGSTITGFTATCTSSNGGTPHTTPTKNAGATSIVVGGLTNGRTYRCTVIATNAKGNSLPSPASAAVVPSTVPGAPASAAVAIGNASINVTFHAPGTGGSAITGYVAACSSTNGGHPGSAAGTRSPLTVTGLTNGKSYTCTVAARNARGTGQPSPASAVVVPDASVAALTTPHAFRLFAGDGGVFTFGTDRSYGSAAGLASHPVVGMGTTPDANGYWLVATDGGIFSFGNAHFYGSTGAMRLNQPIVGMTPTPDAKGYWLVARDGGIFSYGDAHFYGSTGAIHLNRPIVGMSSTPTGHGYWLVASDGGIFSFGDAHFYGTPVGTVSAPVVGMATSADGHGYWIATADGSVSHFGDAPVLGGITVRATRLPVRGIASTPTGHGYWLAAGDGGVFTFGDAPFIGWPGPLVFARADPGCEPLGRRPLQSPSGSHTPGSRFDDRPSAGRWGRDTFPPTRRVRRRRRLGPRRAGPVRGLRPGRGHADARVGGGDTGTARGRHRTGRRRRPVLGDEPAPVRRGPELRIPRLRGRLRPNGDRRAERGLARTPVWRHWPPGSTRWAPGRHGSRSSSRPTRYDRVPVPGSKHGAGRAPPRSSSPATAAAPRPSAVASRGHVPSSIATAATVRSTTATSTTAASSARRSSCRS